MFYKDSFAQKYKKMCNWQSAKMFSVCKRMFFKQSRMFCKCFLRIFENGVWLASLSALYFGGQKSGIFAVL